MKNNIWEIVKKDDGNFEIFRNGKLLNLSIADKWLKAQLGRYGFCGQEYQEIRQQLDELGKAKIVL